MTQSRYPKEVFWSDEDEGFIAIARDLPGCSAFGESEAEALRELDFAIQAWIGAAKKAGNPVPPPSQPADAVQYSGKFMVRVPRDLHRDLVHDAQKNGASLNQWVVYLLGRRTAEQEVKEHVLLPNLTGYFIEKQRKLSQASTAVTFKNIKAMSLREVPQLTKSPWFNLETNRRIEHGESQSVQV